MMVEVPVYNMDGEKIDTLEVDEDRFGGRVNGALLKQVLVAYEANRHAGTAATKSRGMIAGSTRKVFRQKGTGYARRGAVRTNIMRGGGVAFAKRPGRARKRLSKSMRRRALDSAILAKLQGDRVRVVDGLTTDEPKTKTMAGLLRNLKINRSCLLVLGERDRNVYLSARNLPDLTVRVAEELNAFDVAMRQTLLMTSEAMRAMLAGEGKT